MIPKSGYRAVVSKIAVATAVLLAVAAFPQAALGAAEEEPVPQDVMDGIEKALGAKLRELAGVKDAGGNPIKRGTYSRDFKKVDENTYKVGFHEDTAGEDRIMVERYELTVTRDAGGKKWTISGKELKDSWDGLIRSVPEDEEFFAFDSFRFDREGFKATGSKGYLFRDTTLGEVDQFVLVASGLKFEYRPPVDLPYDKDAIYRALLDDHHEYLNYSPAYASIACDPETCDELWNELLVNPRPISKTEAGDKIRRIYNQDFLEPVRESRKKSGFGGFHQPDEKGERYYRISMVKGGLDHLKAGLTYHNLSAHEIHFWIVPGKNIPTLDIFTYHSEDVRKAGTDPYVLEWREEGSARDFDIESLVGEVQLAVRDPESIQGDITYEMNIKRDLQVLPFFLLQQKLADFEQPDIRNPSLFINALEDGEGNELTWVRTGALTGLVVLPEVVPAGNKVTVRVQFDSRETIAKLNTTYYNVPRGGWLPFVRYEDAIEKFDLTVKVPQMFTTLCVGKKTSETKKDGLSVTRWQPENPVHFPTVIFGKYIKDTPKIKATKLDGTEIPVNIYVDETATHELTNLTRSSTREEYRQFGEDLRAGRWGVRPKQLRPLAEQAVNALNLYREIYGVDYPYEKLDLVNDPQGSLYGQAPASIVYLGSLAFRGEGELATFWAGVDASSNTRFTKSLVSHETAHQWWGSLVNNANAQNYWFIESLAEYTSALWVEAIHSDMGKKPEKGFQAYLDHVQEWRDVIEERGLNTSVKDARVNYTGPGGYQAAIYNKGPYAFHMLRMLYGDDKMYAFLKNLAKEFQFKAIVTTDIKRVAEESFDVPMGWFFDQWIYGAGIPELSFNYEYRQTEDGKWLVQGNVKQRVVVGKKKHVVEGRKFMGILYVTVTGRDKQEYEIKLPIRGDKEEFAFKVPVEPMTVEINKKGELLAHDILENRGW